MSNNLPWNDMRPCQPFTKTGEELCACGDLLFDHWVYQEGRPCKRSACHCGGFEFAEENGLASYERSVGNPDYLIDPTFWNRLRWRVRHFRVLRLICRVCRFHFLDL